ncbi:MAG: hypothetical protein A4E19_08375 [Nitrospira sp. SG-bin1]|nr:MAG: hypothetical protein A4E19_08375 [Nitrospira sp. SG-bin1]
MDEQARREFEMYVYSDYARLNEERRGILKGLQTAGWCMADEVILNEAASIERCRQRIQDEHAGDNRTELTIKQGYRCLKSTASL